MNIARIIGAGPLMVIDTRGGGRAQVEAGVQLLHVVQRGDVDAGVADLAVDVRARRRVFAVQGDAVEGGGQARGRLADAEVVEAAVGALRRALAREHADRVLAGAAVRVHAAGVGVVSRAGFPSAGRPAARPSSCRWARRSWGSSGGSATRGSSRTRMALSRTSYSLTVVGDRLQARRPVAQQLQRLGVERLRWRRCSAGAGSAGCGRRRRSVSGRRRGVQVQRLAAARRRPARCSASPVATARGRRSRPAVSMRALMPRPCSAISAR